MCEVVDNCTDAQARELLPLVEEIAEQEPVDEAVQARLMLLLAATGRQVAAVEVFAAVRSRLAEEAGIDPGPELRAAYEKVTIGTERDVPQPAPAVPRQVPAGSRFFAGRETELSWLSALMDSAGAGASVAVIHGLPGVGKTSLVIHWARRSAGDFPDGQLFVDLQGFDPGQSAMDSAQALALLLTGLGTPDAQVPTGVEAAAALFRTLTAGRRLLIILDNARDEEQVRPLLPGSPGVLVVVTSRNRLSGLIAHEGAQSFSLPLPSPAEARAAMRERLGVSRAEDAAALDEIIEICGRLPLALAVVAARASGYPDWPLRAVADELRAGAPLDFLEGDEPRTDVRNVFFWSYRMLSQRAAQLFRSLPAHPGVDFGTSGAANVAGMPEHLVRQLLRELARTMLISQFKPDRYTFHNLIKSYALELSAATDPPGERRAATERITRHLLQVGTTARIALHPSLTRETHDDPTAPRIPIRDVTSAMSWFTAELSALESAAETGLPEGRGWRLAELLMPYYQRRAMYQRWEATAQHALLSAIADGDTQGQAAMHRMIAGALTLGGRSDQEAGIANAQQKMLAAIPHLERALELLDGADRPLDRAHVLRNLGQVYSNLDRHAESRTCFEQALSFFESVDDRRGMSLTLTGLGWVLAEEGEWESGLDALGRAELFAAELDDVNTAGSLAGLIAEVQRRHGRIDPSLAAHHRARELFQRAGNIAELAASERLLGDALSEVGRPEEAVAPWRRAQALYAEIGQAEMSTDLEARIRKVSPGKSPQDS